MIRMLWTMLAFLAISIDRPFGDVLFSEHSQLSMKIIRTEKQRENLAKYFWDMSKVAFAVLVAGPFAKPESFSLLDFSSASL